MGKPPPFFYAGRRMKKDLKEVLYVIYCVCCHSLYRQRKGGGHYLEHIIVSFLISVMASVVGYYICKWLDRKSDDN